MAWHNGVAAAMVTIALVSNEMTRRRMRVLGRSTAMNRVLWVLLLSCLAANLYFLLRTPW